MAIGRLGGRHTWTYRPGLKITSWTAALRGWAQDGVDALLRSAVTGWPAELWVRMIAVNVGWTWAMVSVLPVVLG
jgi:hypothetical protein